MGRHDPPPKGRRRLLRFRRNENGATAIEFGLLALPFFFLMAMIVEFSMVFWTRQVLQEAISQASRTILTGESNALYTGTPAARLTAFRDRVCAIMNMSSDCSSRLFVDVQPFADFPAGRPASMVAASTIDPTTFQLRTVPPGQIAVARVAYTMPVFFSGFMGGLGRLNTGENVVEAVMAFRTEPYPTSSP